MWLLDNYLFGFLQNVLNEGKNSFSWKTVKYPESSSSVWEIKNKNQWTCNYEFAKDMAEEKCKYISTVNIENGEKNNFYLYLVNRTKIIGTT